MNHCWTKFCTKVCLDNRTKTREFQGHTSTVEVTGADFHHCEIGQKTCGHDKPPHAPWWNFARTCIPRTSRTLLNFKVIGQRSRSFSCSQCGPCTTSHVLWLVMQRYIVQTIYRVDIGHIVSYRYRQEKYRNFDISLSFRYRQYAKMVHDNRSPTPLPRYGICYIRFLLTYKISISYRYRDILAISYRHRIKFQKPI